MRSAPRVNGAPSVFPYISRAVIQHNGGEGVSIDAPSEGAAFAVMLIYILAAFYHGKADLITNKIIASDSTHFKEVIF